MSAIEKTKIKVAELPLNDLDLSSAHLTTSNFMQLNVAHYREVPRGKIDADIKSFVRLNPLLRPVMGSGKLNVSSFFVPYRVIWQPFTDFITDSPHNTPNGTMIISSVPTISNRAIIDVLSDSLYSDVVTQSGAVYDFAESGTKYVLKPLGRWALKFLESLGYKVIFGSKTDFNFSCLPILSVAKAYLDWYFPQMYAHTGSFATLDGIFQRHFTYALSVSELKAIFSAVRFVSYDSSIFVNAFDNPLGPNASVGSTDFQFKDVTYMNNGSPDSYGSQVVNGAVGNNVGNGTPVIYRETSEDGRFLSRLSQYNLDSLKALSDYVHRNQLAGSLALQRYIARYGKTLDAAKLLRSYYLGSNSSPIQFGEVMSNADLGTSLSSKLGDFAGKGVIADMGSNFSFETDEFGMFLVLATIQPDVMYYQGIDPTVQQLLKTDFHTPEFDGITNVAISQANVGVAFDNSTYNDGSQNRVFGFAPIYYQYKTKCDHLTGDFRVNSVKGGLMAYSTAREFDVENAVQLVHDFNFVTAAADGQQYNRIFYASALDDIDNFVLIFRNNVHAAFPVKSLYDNYKWDDDVVNKDVSLDVNGAKVN